MPTLTRTRAKSRSVMLREHVTAPPGRINRESGIIHGVKICGLNSANGRTYAESALRDAVPLYEGVAVRFDHPKNLSTERKFVEGFGALRAVRFVPGQGLFGDLYFSTAHPLAGHVLECATKFPNNFGLSHNVIGETSRRNGKTVVDFISDVQSVDIVSEPATSRGLFEAVAHDPQMAAKSVIAEIQNQVETFMKIMSPGMGKNAQRSVKAIGEITDASGALIKMMEKAMSSILPAGPEAPEDSMDPVRESWDRRVAGARTRISERSMPRSRQTVGGSVSTTWDAKVSAARARNAQTGRR